MCLWSCLDELPGNYRCKVELTQPRVPLRPRGSDLEIVVQPLNFAPASNTNALIV